MKYQIWNGTDDIYTPSGTHYTAEQWRAKYSWANIPGAKTVITSGIINGAVAMELTAFAAHYQRMGAPITEEMTDDEILAAIEEFEDNPPGAGEPSTEERTAAALEFIALSSLPDEAV